MNKTVSSHTNSLDAYIVCNRLQIEGIPACVQFQHHIGAKWSISNALGGVRVQVPCSCVEEANQIIENINQGKYQLETENKIDIADLVRCPNCNSTAVIQDNWFWKSALLMAFLLPIPIPYTQHLKKCQECHYSWIASNERNYSLTTITLAILFSTAIAAFSFYMVEFIIWILREKPYIWKI